MENAIQDIALMAIAATARAREIAKFATVWEYAWQEKKMTILKFQRVIIVTEQPRVQ
jgi:hypothetical protein